MWRSLEFLTAPDTVAPDDTHRGELLTNAVDQPSEVRRLPHFYRSWAREIHHDFVDYLTGRWPEDEDSI